MSRPRLIAIANHKGGAAKTTTTVSLSACLAEQGFRVLVIDLDPQSNTSSWLGFNGGDGMYKVLTEGDSLESQIRASSVANLSVITGSHRLATAEKLLATELGAETLLRQRFVAWDSAGWDYVLIDTPPALGLLTINALTAVSEVLIPVEAHVLALSGVAQIMGTITLVKERLNLPLKLTGLVVCRFDGRTRHSAEVRERLVEKFQDQVFTTVIRENVRLAEAPSFGAPITLYDSASTGAADYRALAREIAQKE